MAQQKIKYQDKGARVQRVLEALTPLNGTAAPAVQAAFLGQQFIDTVAKKAYIAIATDSVDPADDWKEITFVTGE